MKITVIPAKEKMLERAVKKKVAAYARVSTDKDDQESSYETQVGYFTRLIQCNPEWDFVGVYTDNGISGTSITHRKQFLKMLDDCRAGKIDIILAKSISRFSRNTVDLLNTIRELKDLGIEVRFEKEGIRTLDSGGEVFISLMATFAQYESESLSENVKWGMRKKFEKGDPCGCGTEVYGYRWVDGEFVIEPQEAKVIRQMFRMLLRGDSIYSITNKLNKDGRRTVRGKRFNVNTVRRILGNELYIGNLLLQKTYRISCLDKKVKKNKGDRTQYYFTKHHPAIIDEKTFKEAQGILEERARLGVLTRKDISCFTRKIECGICGQSYSRYSVRDYAAWVCKTRKSGKDCASRYLPEKKLKECCCEVLGITDFDEKIFLGSVEKIVVPEFHRLTFYLKDGTVEDRTWVSDAHKTWWTPERKAERRRKNKDRRRAE